MSTESQSSAFGGGNDPDTTGATLPPYEDRRESAEVDGPSQSTKDDAKVAGATGPVEDPEMKGPEPAETERGATASPADEQPAGEMTQTESSDPGVGPAHVPGTPRGEDLSES